MKHPNPQSQERGFTLLLAALVASIVLSLGAAIYSIAIKQVTLSSIGRDSQFAFYTADTLAECVLYWDLRQGLFGTTSPPTEITCNGVAAEITTTSDTGGSSNGSCYFTRSGGTQISTCSGGDATTFVVPQHTSMTIEIVGGSGGGGGGADGPFSGSDAESGTATTFDTATAAGGEGGGGAPSGGNGTQGGDGNGGNGGLSNGSSYHGGDGGGGETVIYPSDIPEGTPIAVAIGMGGTGGTGGNFAGIPGQGQNGDDGNPGQVVINWVSSASSWSSTEFAFQFDGTNCGTLRLTKTLVGGIVQSVIRSDGANVPCPQIFTDPHALQRSVELNY